MPTEVTYTSRIPEIIAELDSALPGVVHEAAAKFVAVAKAHARVRTGKMRDSIHAEPMGEFVADIVADAVNEEGRPYAIYNEFGTRYMSAQPMFGPAAEIVRPEFVDDCAMTLRAIVEG